MKIMRNHSKAVLLSRLAVLLIVVGGGLSTKLYLDLRDAQPKIGTLVKHIDISQRPMETFTRSLITAIPKDREPYPASSCPRLPLNWVSQENQKPGVNMTMKSWHIVNASNPVGSALWLDKTSVSCGERVGIHASVHLASQAPRGARTFQAFRIGWYAGTGARLVWKSNPIQLTEQRIPVVKSVERMVETKWTTTVTFTVGRDWTPGFYLIASISPQAKIESIAPLIVRSSLGNSKLLLIHSTLTWQAYNQFGGRSLYLGPGGSIVSRRLERSRVVSFDRPYDGSGALHLDRDGITLVQFIEKQGLNVDQISDVNLDQWPSVSNHYNGIVFGGHAEYFTRRMFDTITGNRNHGVNLAFLGANNAYWQTRLVDSSAGPNRHVIVYRSAPNDPVTASKGVTVQFQDPRVNTPPNLLTGTLTSGVHVYGNMQAVDIPQWLHIPKTASINGISGDTEIDSTAHNIAQPSQVHILFSGKMEFRNTGPSTDEEDSNFEEVPIAETIWFTTPSGAAVFNAGLTTWTCNLLASCISHSVDARTESTLQSVTTQVLTLWQRKAVGRNLK